MAGLTPIGQISIPAMQARVDPPERCGTGNRVGCGRNHGTEGLLVRPGQSASVRPSGQACLAALQTVYCGVGIGSASQAADRGQFIDRQFLFQDCPRKGEAVRQAVLRPRRARDVTPTGRDGVGAGANSSGCRLARSGSPGWALYPAGNAGTLVIARLGSAVATI